MFYIAFAFYIWFFVRTYLCDSLSENIRTLFVYSNLLFKRVPNFANDIVRLGILGDHKVMWGKHICESLPNENFKRLVSENLQYTKFEKEIISIVVNLCLII